MSVGTTKENMPMCEHVCVS